jgi:excinuclease UvrABC nuclease subunit
MASGIYAAFNSNGMIIYVGMTKGSATRWSKHRVPLRGGYQINNALARGNTYDMIAMRRQVLT